MIKNHKEVCRKLAPQGWQYGGLDDEFYCFQSGNYKDGFREMLLIEQDLEPKNIALMIKLNLTRVKGFKNDQIKMARDSK